MKNQPLVSVVIPTYNRADLLPRAIKSVLNQTFQNFELIIVDDGSVDDTKRIVKKFIKMSNKINYIYQENRGESAARNLGKEKTKGNYIAFLDSDDEWLSEKLEKQIKLFQQSKFSENLGFVGCYGFVVKDNNQSKNNPFFIHRIPNFRGNILKEILSFCCIFSPSSVLIKREAIINEKFDENIKLGPDWDMWIRIAQKYDFDFVEEPLFKYYLHQENITKTLEPLKGIRDQEYILKKHRDIYKEYPKAHSINLRNIGSMYLLNNDLKMARKYFIKAIKVAPWHPRSYFNLIVSLFGIRFYKIILFIKQKLFLKK